MVAVQGTSSVVVDMLAASSFKAVTISAPPSNHMPSGSVSVTTTFFMETFLRLTYSR